MKRSTYIMMTLIISGLVLGVSFYAFVHFAGERCDSYDENDYVISASADTIPLPHFDSMDILPVYIGAQNSNYRPVYVMNHLEIHISVDSCATEPYLVVPVTFSENVDVKTQCNSESSVTHNDIKLSVEVGCVRSYYIRKDYSAPITVILPAGMKICSSSFVGGPYLDIDARLSGLDMDNYIFESTGKIALDINDCKFTNMSVDGIIYKIKLTDSRLSILDVKSTKDVTIETDVRVDNVNLAGSGVTYTLKGDIENYKVFPDSASTITVEKEYTCL